MKHFVTFEGIDGCGKSTVSKLVYEQLRKKGFGCVNFVITNCHLPDVLTELL